MKEFDKLSLRQQNILIYMDRYMTENGFPPTIREIGKATSIESTSVVNYNLNKLVQAGFLERVESKSRGLRLVREIPNGHGRVVRIRESSKFVAVPVLGRIVASEPVNVPSADMNVDEDSYIDVPPFLLEGIPSAELFALHVSGDSMIDAMIQDGDIVVMRKVKTVNNGEMVAVWLDDRSETTLKRYYLEGNRVRLQPANPTMQPIYADAQHCYIQGKVVSVMRRLKH